MSPVRVGITVVALALLAAACGQKSDVGESEAPEDAAAVATTTAPADDGADDSTTTSAPEAPAGREPGPNDTSGVSDDEIVIGVHAPVTGASPIPQEAFDIGKDIYWSFLADNDPEFLFGRTVRVVFRDDTFDPNEAVSVCREMVEEEGAFLLVGAAGADQITACARYASENDIPYLSAGVNEEGLTELSTYFASTLTYAQQAPILIDEVSALGASEIGVVVIDTPSFEDARDAIVEAAEAAGITVAADISMSKNPTGPETLATVQQLKDAGVEVVVVLMSPVAYGGLANEGKSQAFEPVYVGPGITNGLNAVTTFFCDAVENGEFLSPVPGLDVVDDLDPDFREAYAQYAGQEADDVGLQLWALNKALALMLNRAGEELGRAAFMNALESGETFDNGLYAPIQFSPDDHFGGSGAHLLDADCAVRQYTTAEQFIPAE